MDNKKTSLGGRLASSEAFLSVAASLICIVIGLLLGVVVLAVINAEHAVGDGLLVILQSGIKSPRNMGTVLANAAPLIMTGLSVGFAFKTGLFNIGAAGQYTLGAFGALYCAIVLQLPWYLCLLAAMVLGALWGAIPGFFKAYMNINEVITSIMFNWIGLYMVNDIMYGKGQSPMYDLATTKTYSLRKVAPGSMIPSCGMSDHFGKLQSVTIAIFIALFFAIVVYVVLNKTTFGYELKACGFNKNAAQYAGINDKRNIILSMTIAGALAGVGAGLYYLSTVAEWNPQVSTALPAIGFNGISAALLACSNPIGTIFSSLFISYITVGGTKLSTQYYTKEIADVITAL
ncbi:MAG: ABC transporter permease, partial [Clostridiales bacterium]|nr:ABC transporter permease [Clostridiales bacterium]